MSFHFKNKMRVQPINFGSRGVTCRNFPGLSKKQLELCYRYPDVMEAAIHGLQLAVRECQFQFQKHRWNCSVLETKNRNPHSSVFLQKGSSISSSN
jgi:wingless-type MMTV integration site family, member 10